MELPQEVVEVASPSLAVVGHLAGPLVAEVDLEHLLAVGMEEEPQEVEGFRPSGHKRWGLQVALGDLPFRLSCHPTRP